MSLIPEHPRFGFEALPGGGFRMELTHKTYPVTVSAEGSTWDETREKVARAFDEAVKEHETTPANA